MSEWDQAAVIAFLADPASHGGAAVERIDTHASIVFLAGERAYKLKRAVRFSYLDYSTPALREQACRAELALNRRTAAELYEEVCPIARAPDGRLALGGPGAAIDWVVVMRRFDQETLFDRMAERGQLSTTLMFDLAEQIARFHAAAEIDSESGGAPGMAATTASDAHNLRAAVPATLDAAGVEALIAATQATLARVALLLDARRRAGKVRHCHGDLHLRNICLVAGRSTLFDCVEFNRLISNIDVLYDLSFLLMDLHTRALDALGNAVFNRYLDLQDESDGLPAVPLFFPSAPPSVPMWARPEPGSRRRRRRRRARARRSAPLFGPCRRSPETGAATPSRDRRPQRHGQTYRGLRHGPGAWRRARRPRAPLRRHPQAPVPRGSHGSPAVIGLQHRGGPARLPADARGGRGRAGRRALGRHRRGLPRRAERDAIATVAAKAQVPFVGLWLDAPMEALAARIAARRGDASDATAAVLRQQLTYDLGDIDWHRIDASGAADAVIDAGPAGLRARARHGARDRRREERMRPVECCVR